MRSNLAIAPGNVAKSCKEALNHWLEKASVFAQFSLEKADEIKHRDFCVEQFNFKELQTEKKEDLIALVKDHQWPSQLRLQPSKSEVDGMQMQHAGQGCEKQNVYFQCPVADKQASQKQLIASLNILKSLRKKKARKMAPSAFKDVIAELDNVQVDSVPLNIDCVLCSDILARCSLLVLSCSSLAWRSSYRLRSWTLQQLAFCRKQRTRKLLSHRLGVLPRTRLQ